MNWSDERPTEPGEYWLSLKPSSRAGILPTKRLPTGCDYVPALSRTLRRNQWGRVWS